MSAVLGAPTTAARLRWLPWAWLLALATVLAAYRDTFAAMVGIWERSDTFAHAFLVPPLALWLVWRQRQVLRTQPLRPHAAWLGAAAAAALLWCVGDLVGVNVATQLAATALLVLSVPAVLGTAVARVIVFPLCFLFFMVPIGEFVMPTLMQWTADVTVFALRSFGVPVFREGLQFVIPSGSWSVIEACSGVRYLIASFMVGTLFAYLNYRSTRRRVAFALLSLVVPVLANWVRAVAIVMLGHLSDNRLATGVDHLVYGWLFFGVVVGLMFFIGMRWAEAPAAETPAPAVPPATATAADAPHAAWPAVAVTSAFIVLVACPQLAGIGADAEARPLPALALPTLALPAAPAGATPLHTPFYEGAAAEASRVYGDGPAAVTVHVAYYRHQTYGHKLVNSQNTLVRSDDRRWHLTSAGTQDLLVAGQPRRVQTAELRAGNVGAAQPDQRLQVRRLLWVGGRWTHLDAMAVALALFGRVDGSGDDAAAVTFYIADDGSGAAAAALDAFVAQNLDSLSTWLSSVRAVR